MATQPLEDVAKAGKDGPLQLFQLYVIKDRKFCKSLIQREDMHHFQCIQSGHLAHPYGRLFCVLWACRSCQALLCCLNLQLDAVWFYSCMHAADKGIANAPCSSRDPPLKIYFS